MSSAGRSADVRRESDFYKTPEWVIESFLREVQKDVPGFLDGHNICDPCAGGDDTSRMPYPAVLALYGHEHIMTIDIREDSGAGFKGDFLEQSAKMARDYDLVISNPPYSLAVEFVKKALEIAAPGGYVAFLLRINFLGAQCRHDFWQETMPSYIYVHSKRPSFTNGGNDSTEYAHFVWVKGHNPKHTQLRVI